MSTLLLTHPSSLLHEMGEGHPECPERIQAVMDHLQAEDFASLLREVASGVTLEAMLRAHSVRYVKALDACAPQEGYFEIDADTCMNSSTWPAAQHAAGAAVHAVDAVFQRRAGNAFVAMRPPGHHSGQESAMGFCFLNNVAIAARHAMASHGAERVAIVDFDVHHGNGTQEIFYSDRQVLYCSSHEMPLFPGTGRPEETGHFDQICNVAMQAGDDGAALREAYREIILPRVHNFAPDLILISAGFDAHKHDPLGNLMLEADDFYWVTGKLCDLANRHCGDRVVSLLEGGYSLEGLAQSAGAHVRALMGR
ncbi:MAG: histone deacetylase family protein [Hyphomicrobiales bacterium]|nr:histone deacetylase family protein [Hyphomicrobiales bacterium]